MQTNQKILSITAGEPAGIGADICLDLATMDLPCRIVVLGDQSLLQQRAQLLQKSVKIRAFDATRQPEKNTLDVLHIPLRETCVVGQLNPQNSPYVLELLDKAMAGIANGEFAAMITAPIHKGVINDYFGERLHFSGHTEYLAAQSGTKQVVMMLAGGGMRVALLTTHLPLRDVADAITPELISSVAKILHDDLKKKFGIQSPKILLAGLNPHAGENGYLGREELEIMQPTATKLREQGIQISDPLPADTLFQPHYLQHADAILAAYHDQGLPVLKYASFGGGVNITLGLPFIRTSVDHGTALDLAGTGKAHSGSLKTAVEMAWQMVQAQNK
ncbi:4-hydroxythreonine-4-phosphate dehydrogenase PdxA [Wielerella bovis]|uniref:4-hydroxythreonine-4-phosphate dehydrogenase PdxA n=1 Tax=Wielerella bovis TaxID=2917790 RepID=UPI002019077B|nr:4-hydroxythreonine-4-phosphate dehydrogenase PdxA [Wielerella bovis]ULJ63565.1 4-hydroxythreonine-4-phosphate dehydrogenase PdxA [Wielerella bovis]